jgi:hypothetical protein
MPMSGEAKARYQREYMRRRRAGAKPEQSQQLVALTFAAVGDMLALDAVLKARVRELEAELARERGTEVP